MCAYSVHGCRLPSGRAQSECLGRSVHLSRGRVCQVARGALCQLRGSGFLHALDALVDVRDSYVPDNLVVQPPREGLVVVGAKAHV